MVQRSYITVWKNLLLGFRRSNNFLPGWENFLLVNISIFPNDQKLGEKLFE
tara:strand:+ start:775 stop:927 length:153 start_codon:yes stop_codon:yes gene_type:complete